MGRGIAPSDLENWDLHCELGSEWSVNGFEGVMGGVGWDGSEGGVMGDMSLIEFIKVKHTIHEQKPFPIETQHIT